MPCSHICCMLQPPFSGPPMYGCSSQTGRASSAASPLSFLAPQLPATSTFSSASSFLDHLVRFLAPQPPRSSDSSRSASADLSLRSPRLSSHSSARGALLASGPPPPAIASTTKFSLKVRGRGDRAQRLRRSKTTRSHTWLVARVICTFTNS